MALLVFVQTENPDILHIDGLVFFPPHNQNLIFGAVASGDHHTLEFHTMPQRLLHDPVQHQTGIHLPSGSIH